MYFIQLNVKIIAFRMINRLIYGMEENATIKLKKLSNKFIEGGIEKNEPF